MNELLEELKAYHQQMFDEINDVSPDPDIDPNLDFDLGYLAGMGMVLKKFEELINA